MTRGEDVSIPYDAAARLAYDEWRKKYNKGDFDENRFQNFKANYEAITVSNVIAKKKAREEGNTDPSLLMLNEYGDFTVEEYDAAIKKGPPSTSDILSEVLKANEAQSEVSAALKEAADALALEEEVR